MRYVSLLVVSAPSLLVGCSKDPCDPKGSGGPASLTECYDSLTIPSSLSGSEWNEELVGLTASDKVPGSALAVWHPAHPIYNTEGKTDVSVSRPLSSLPGGPPAQAECKSLLSPGAVDGVQMMDKGEALEMAVDGIPEGLPGVRLVYASVAQSIYSAPWSFEGEYVTPDGTYLTSAPYQVAVHLEDIWGYVLMEPEAQPLVQHGPGYWVARFATDKEPLGTVYAPYIQGDDGFRAHLFGGQPDLTHSPTFAKAKDSFPNEIPLSLQESMGYSSYMNIALSDPCKGGFNSEVLTSAQAAAEAAATDAAISVSAAFAASSFSLSVKDLPFMGSSLGRGSANPTLDLQWGDMFAFDDKDKIRGRYEETSTWWQDNKWGVIGTAVAAGVSFFAREVPSYSNTPRACRPGSGQFDLVGPIQGTEGARYTFVISEEAAGHFDIGAVWERVPADFPFQAGDAAMVPSYPPEVADLLSESERRFWASWSCTDAEGEVAVPNATFHKLDLAGFGIDTDVYLVESQSRGRDWLELHIQGLPYGTLSYPVQEDGTVFYLGHKVTWDKPTLTIEDDEGLVARISTTQVK